MYAYKKTMSMHKSISETKRRREIQMEFNEKNQIVPQTIVKEVKGGVLETLRGKKKQRGKVQKKVEVKLSPGEIDQRIIELKKQMKELAKNLEFEEAAKIRDEIKELNEARLIF